MNRFQRAKLLMEKTNDMEKDRSDLWIMRNHCPSIFGGKYPDEYVDNLTFDFGDIDNGIECGCRGTTCIECWNEECD